MAKMRIGAAFSESFAFLKANWVQMMIWAGGALLLLCAIGFVLLGSTFAAMAGGGGDPSALLAAFGRIFLFALVAGVVLYAACMLIWRGGMHPGEAPNFGWALQAGPAFAFGTFVLMLVVYLLFGTVAFVFLLIFGIGFSPAALQSGAMGGGTILMLAFVYIGFLVFMLWIQARISVAGPVMADRLTRNPVTGFVESWKLTRASQWTIVLFLVVFAILTFVYILVVGLIGGAVFGAIASGSMIGSIIMTIVSAAVIYLPILMLSFSVPIGLYRTLAPRASGDVFA